MIEHFTPGQAFFSSDSPRHAFSVVFEDDGETAYFYAVNRGMAENQIVDALHIYNVESVADKNRESELEIVWSPDNLKAALLINHYAHAVFDFDKKRGFCRMEFPKSSKGSDHAWTEPHLWDDAAMNDFDRESS